MTELMLPLLEKAAPDSRVITVSSGGMYTTPLTEDLQVHGLVYFSSAACLLQFSSTCGISHYLSCCSLAVAILMGWNNMLETSEFRLGKIGCFLISLGSTDISLCQIFFPSIFPLTYIL